MLSHQIEWTFNLEHKVKVRRLEKQDMLKICLWEIYSRKHLFCIDKAGSFENELKGAPCWKKQKNSNDVLNLKFKYFISLCNCWSCMRVLEVVDKVYYF